MTRVSVQILSRATEYVDQKYCDREFDIFMRKIIYSLCDIEALSRSEFFRFFKCTVQL